MGMYSIVEPNQKILDSLKDSKTALIVGCANCANISVGHDKNLPIYHISTDEKTGIKSSKPVAIVEEAKRLQRILKTHGVKADIEVNPSYCSPWTDQTELLGPLGYPPDLKDRGVDAVVALTCSEGLKGVNKRVKGGVNVVWGMRTVGGHEPVLRFDAASGDVFVDEAKSKF